MTARPRVSVITATWNWSQALRLSLRSALAQTERAIEVLVVADGCTDDTADAVRATRDRRVRLIELPERSGSQSAPNNRGIAEARAPWVAYLGHDDLWHPRHLATLLAAADAGAVDLAYAVGLIYGPPGTGQRSVSGITRSGRPERNAFFPPTTILHRRDLTERVGAWGDPAAIALPVDVDLQARAWDAGLRFAGSGHATAFKFPAAFRRDAYRRRDVSEQAALLARLERDPDGTLAEELVGLAAALARNEGGLIEAPAPAAAGAHHRRNLAHKGADADPDATPLPAVHVVGADRLDGPGEWYGLEADAGGRAFRWSGPARTACADLRLDAAPRLVVEALLLHALTPDQWAGARLVVDGEPQATVRCAPEDGVGTLLRAEVAPAAERGGDRARLRVGVEVPRTVPVVDVHPESVDARRLGVGVAWIGARPAS